MMPVVVTLLGQPRNTVAAPHLALPHPNPSSCINCLQGLLSRKPPRVRAMKAKLYELIDRATADTLSAPNLGINTDIVSTINTAPDPRLVGLHRRDCRARGQHSLRHVIPCSRPASEPGRRSS